MWNLIYTLVNDGVLLYGFTVAVWYFFLAMMSMIEMRAYLKRNYFIDYSYILSSPFAPGISLLAPAYNESLTIIDNVKSLLSLMYNNYEVIIINDGSKDETLSKLIMAFDLQLVPLAYEMKLPTKPVRGIYKSRNRAFRKLVIIDKVNGGKADALNVGLNLANKPLVACIDVDCIIEPDALLKMAKPFLEDREVIASGGVVRIANSCVVEEGRLVEVKLPTNMLAKMQVLEYIRAFLLGRMAWSKLNGLLLISGAFGLFRRDIAVQSGGYDPNTVGEDMELVVRMRCHMHDNKLPYRVAYIPDPLCWTEAPSTNEVLGRQRNRWARGTFETLRIHKKLLFNPKYGLMGMVSYPFWLVYEWASPMIESTGLLFFLLLIILGKVNWLFFFSLMLAIYCFAFFLSMFALLTEEISYYKYTHHKDILKMIGASLIEPFWFHPRVVWWSLVGNWKLMRGEKSWGTMTRKGFVEYRKNVAKA